MTIISDYRKQIEASDSNMVTAEVFYTNGTKDIRRCGLAFFWSPLDSLERRFLKAHRWANNRIRILSENEVAP